MRSEKHIISLLEESPLHALQEDQLAAIQEHVAGCNSCNNAYRAAQISSNLLEVRAAEKIEPSPFFETRVMARVRELRTANEGWQLGKLWRAAGALCSSMVATVVVLGVLTFALPGEQSVATQEFSSINRPSAEAIILNQTDIPDDASDGQVLGSLYATEEDAAR
jgi:hypothetical protein